MTIKRSAATALAAGLLLLMMLLFAGCGQGKNVVLTTGMKKNEVFRISDKTCLLPEIMVYLTNMQNQYESIYGTGIWESAQTKGSMEEQAKEQVLAELAQIKAMVLLAQSRGTVLDQMEEDRVNAAAREYYASLNAAEIKALGVNAELIAAMYKDYALARKVYGQIIGSVNPEISDDEARTVTVVAIRLIGETEAREVLELAREEGADFESLAERRSKDTQITYSFGKGEMDRAIEKAAFELGKNEISSVIKGEDGYYVIKCINTFDEAQTRANKEKIADQRRSEAFAGVYESFVDTLPRQINEELWNTVEMIRDEEVTTGSFFATYEKYFAIEQ